MQIVTTSLNKSLYLRVPEVMNEPTLLRITIQMSDSPGVKAGVFYRLGPPGQPASAQTSLQLFLNLSGVFLVYYY